MLLNLLFMFSNIFYMQCFYFQLFLIFFFFYINGKILHTLHGTKPWDVNLGIRREDPTNNKSKQAGP